MRSLLCNLVCLLAVLFWIMAWSTFDVVFIIAFALIAVATWLITLLLRRAARALRRIAMALATVAFGLLMIFDVPSREFVHNLLNGLSTEGPHLFVWAIVFTIMCAICRSSRAARSSS